MKTTYLIGALLLLATSYVAHSEVSQQPYIGEGAGGPVDPAATEPGQTRKVPRRRPPPKSQRPQADADDSAIPELPRRGESSGATMFQEGGNPSGRPATTTGNTGATNPSNARQQAAEILAVLRPILLQSAFKNPALAQKLAVLEGLVANSPQEALAAMRPLLADAAARNPALARKLELLDALTGGSPTGPGTDASYPSGSVGGARGVPIEECNRQANASTLAKQLDALPPDNINLKSRGTIVSLDFLIRTYTPCLPYPQLQQQIDQWKATRAQTLRVCQQTSSDPASCLRSPYQQAQTNIHTPQPVQRESIPCIRKDGRNLPVYDRKDCAGSPNRPPLITQPTGVGVGR